MYPPLAALYLKSYVAALCPSATIHVGGDMCSATDIAECEPYDVVAISVMTPQRLEALAMSRAIKARWPEKRVVWGGPHVKHYHQDLCRERSIDYRVTHDGEVPLALIAAGRATTSTLTSLLTRAEIMAAPRPDRTSPDCVAVLREHRYEIDGRPATTMLTARGCPELCTFCEEAGTNVRWSSVNNIREEVGDIRQLGYRAVYLFDDLFAIAPKAMRPVCDVLASQDMKYRCNVQARYFTRCGDEVARLLADSGCVEVAFGAESGSQAILDRIQKRCTVAQNYLTVKLAKERGLRVKAFILLGLPGETQETLRETEAFIAGSGIDDFQCAVYMPYRGTKIRQDIEAGVSSDIMLLPLGADGDVSGAYGVKGGQTSYEVRTRALSAEALAQFRDYLVMRYRPRCHRAMWQEDRFFDTQGYV
ncbi:B12-binding domain-containing radical SAM protein [Luteitalea sp.]